MNRHSLVVRFVQSCPRRHGFVLASLLAAASSPVTFAGDIFKAVTAGDVATVQNLLQQKPDLVFQTLHDGTTPLLLAAFHGQIELAKLLLSNKSDIEATNRNGDTPLFLAAYKNHTELAALLVAANARVDVVNKRGETPLHAAAYTGDRATAQLLLAKKAPVNVKANNGVTPLHNAASLGFKEIAELLLAAGADINAQTNIGDTPLILAISTGHKDLVELLLANHAGLEVNNQHAVTPLLLSAYRGHKEITRLLLAAGANINAKSENGSTPLHNAASSGSREVAELLLAAKADVNSTNSNGDTPLMIAVFNKHTEMAAFLLANKADVDTPNQSGVTPLHMAADKGPKEMVELLLANNANIAAKNKNGGTPWDVATVDHHDDIVQLLQQHGGLTGSATPSVSSKKPPDPREELAKAALAGDLKTVETSLREHPDLVSSENAEGHTLLFVAAEEGNKALARILLDAGANVNTRDRNGLAPLDVAVLNGRDLEFLELLFNRGAQVNGKTTRGETPLHQAARGGHKDAAELLFVKGADVNAKTTDGWTALAIASHTLQAPRLTLNGKTVSNLFATDRSIPIGMQGDVAAQGHTEVARLLREYGAIEEPAPIPQAATPGAGSAMLQSGGVCTFGKRGLGCIKNNGFTAMFYDTAPRLHNIDGLDSKAFYNKNGKDRGAPFNKGWNAKFKVELTAGPHVVTASFFQSVGTMGTYSGNIDLFFVALPGHSYEVDSLVTQGNTINPSRATVVVIDVTDKNGFELVSRQ